MKLHLPKLLRHAVLVCIAAVAGVASTVGTAAITSGAVTFALLGSYAEAAVPNATYTDDGTTRTYTGTGVITVPAADSVITKIVFGMSEPGSGDNRSYFNAGFTCNTAVQIGTSAGNGIDINDGTSGATYAFTGAISGEGIWRVMGSPTSKTKITGSMEGFTGQLIGGTAPTFQLATTCNASVVEIGKLQLVGNVAFTGGSAGDHASITLGNVTSDADTQLTLGEYTVTTLNGTIALRKSIVNNGSITLGDNVVFDLANLAAVDGVYTLFTNAVDLSGLDASAVSVNLSDGKAIRLNANGTISVVDGTVGNRIWKNNGASDTWAAASDLNWTADGADAFFVNGCTVQFGESATATGETIEMVNNLNIGGMTVYGTGWEFAGSGSITSTGNLAIEENATVKYSTSGTVSVTSVEMKTGSTLTLSGTKLTATAPTADVNLRTIKLESGKYYFFCNASKRKTSIEQL
ncbi:MAG: hypothetical protein IKK73_00195, partial [Akkermansia sp.]|nr:hypothetical protein [Akkermansia sp.]